MSDYDSLTEEEKFPFSDQEVYDHTKSFKMSFNGRDARVYKNNIYKRCDKRWKKMYTLNGIEKVWYASDVNRDTNFKEQEEDKQGFLIFTTDKKYITNIYFDIIEFTLKPGYEITGYSMKWFRRIDDNYAVGITIESKSEDKYYFVYNNYKSRDLDLKCIEIIGDDDYYCECSKLCTCTEEQKNACYGDSCDYCKDPECEKCKCKKDDDPFEFCYCYGCTLFWDVPRALSNHLNLAYEGVNVSRVMKPDFIVDVNFLINYGEW
jgi:hypothetical protein